MKLNFLKTLPLMAAMIIAASCGSNDKDPVTPKPAPKENTSEATDNGDGTFTVPFTVKVSTCNSLTKKMEYSAGEDGQIKIEFKVGENDDSKLRVSGQGVKGELGLVSDDAGSYTFSGDLTLSDGVTTDNLEQGKIDLNYEYGEALTEPASSDVSLLDLVQNCNHLYKGTAQSNVSAIELTDQNTYLAISMSPFTNHEIKINGTELTVKKEKDGRLWVAVPSGNEVKSKELGLDQPKEEVRPSEYHTVARQCFSVSATKKVYFSPGNLQYNVGATAQTKWRFAPTQYDKCFEDGYHFSSDEYIKADHAGWTAHDGWIDLFGWGTWTVNGTQAPNSTDANYNNYETGVANNGDFENACKADIINALGAGWTTLSYDEWIYLLGYDNNADATCRNNDNAKALRATKTVGGVLGLVILPDGATANIATDSWETLESAGAVFLPAAGDRYGTDVFGVGSYGYYWSSTADDANGAYHLAFGSGSVDPDIAGDRGNGISVRLVRAL